MDQIEYTNEFLEDTCSYLQVGKRSVRAIRSANQRFSHRKSMFSLQKLQSATIFYSSS